MTTRIWRKTETQETIKALREAGFAIPPKSNMMYQTEERYKNEQGHMRPVFSAQEGSDHYLVSFHPELFGEEGDEANGE